jgi:uncharacterized protein (TIGR03437 family)
VYPLTAGPAWTQQQEFTVSDGAAKDYVGCSVSVNVDTAVIGAFGRNNQQGSAYVLVRNGTVWTQQQELTASDGAAGDLFGHSVSVSGDTAVIGAFGRSSQSGAAYVFVRSGGVWSQQQELTAPDGRASEAFGVSVSVSGDTAVIGAYNTDSDRGAAYVFVRSGGVWSQQQKLTAADGAASDQFGLSVSVSGDTAVVGALGKNANRGAAYVFSRSGGVWSQQQELTASDGVTGDWFGSSVSVDGDTIIIGAEDKTVNSASQQGAAYLFVQSGGIWNQQQELTASDGAPNDIFGSSVSVSGDTAAIGAEDAGGGVQGAAYVFMRNGWAWTQQQELTASDAGVDGFFGKSISVSGDTAVIGSDGKSFEGAAYVFVLITPTTPQTIAFAALANQQIGAAPFAVGATASSGLPVSFASLTPSVCAVSGATVWVISVGTCTIQATQSGDVTYLAATPVSQSFQVLALGQTISFGALANQVVGAAPFQIAATASSGLPVSFASLTTYVCTVSRSTVTVAAAGICTIQATQAGNADYAAAASVNRSFTVAAAAISGVGVSGGGVNIAQNSWVSVYGVNLAPASVGGLTWSSAPSFASGQMPTSLGGVSVTVNAKPAYIYFVSPTQVNVLTPLDSTTGPVAVVVNNGSAVTAAFIANLQAAAPGFLRFGDGVHIAAMHADFSYLGPASMSVNGSAFTPAAPGETIMLFGDGLGLPATALTAGSMYQSSPLATWPQITIGGTTAEVQWAGLISPGLYQINVTIPATAATGDNEVIATYAGFASPNGAMIPVAQ